MSHELARLHGHHGKPRIATLAERIDQTCLIVPPERQAVHLADCLVVGGRFLTYGHDHESGSKAWLPEPPFSWFIRSSRAPNRKQPAGAVSVVAERLAKKIPSPRPEGAKTNQPRATPWERNANPVSSP